MAQDIRYALRMLVKSPGFSAIALLTLALGIGANTAIFSVVNAVLLRPLPYPQPERIVALWEQSARRNLERARVSGPNLIDWREQNRVFERIGFSFGRSDYNLVNSDGVEKVMGVYADSGLFAVLGINPLLGRVFLPEEDRPEGNRVAIIGYGLWQRRFGGDLNALGQTITVDTFGRRDYTIVGVMPPGFRYPGECELWLPAGWMGVRMEGRRSGHWFEVIARLKAGVSLTEARSEMNAIQARIDAEHPREIIGSQVEVVELLEQTLGPRLRPALLVLWAAVICVLLIACVNVANLLLARSAARQKEFALRLALGASRLRLARQLLVESLILSLAGGAMGVLLSLLALGLFVRLGADQIPRLAEVAIDASSLAFTLLVALVAGLLFGLAPALQFSRPDLYATLKEGGKGATAALDRSRLRRMLVVAEVGLSLMLLVGAGLMARSLAHLTGIDRGFRPDHLLTARLDFSVSGFTTWVRPTSTRPQVAIKEIIERIASLPGVESAAASSKLPQDIGSARTQHILIENHPLPAPGEYHTADFQGVTPDYFKAMGILLRAGRVFNEGDTLEAPGVAIINETSARRFFPNENPIGQRLALGPRNVGQAAASNEQPQWSVIVGVVADMKKLHLQAETVPDIYVPYWQWPMQSPVLLVRTGASPERITAAIREEVKAVNRNLPPPAMRMMSEILSDSVAEPRFQTLLVSLFGLLAIVLAIIGIYGVISYSVAQRTHEMGVRIALGAQRSDIFRLIIGQGMMLVMIGIAIGLGGAWATTRIWASLLHGVSAQDPVTFAAVPLLLVAVALIACYLPARRATRVNPMTALREE